MSKRSNKMYFIEDYQINRTNISKLIKTTTTTTKSSYSSLASSLPPPASTTSSPSPQSASRSFASMNANQFIETPQKCIRSSDNATGTCIAADDCPQLIEEYKEFRIKPQLCSFDGIKLLFCCPNRKKPVEIAKNLDEPYDNRKISEIKCDEYSKLAFKKYPYMPLLLNPVVYEYSVPQCKYSAPLIVGGEEAKVSEFPHMAAIGWTNPQTGIVLYLCGGSLISENFILTAAHCLSSDELPDTIRLGAHNLYSTNIGEQFQDFFIEKIVKHPEYIRSSNYHDIALIQMNRNAKFNKFIRPACLWQKNELKDPVTVATGWGRTSFAGDQSKVLLKVVLNVIERKLCQEFYRPSRRLIYGLIDSQMCAGFLAGERDTCHGDSGGPLQISIARNECIFHIVGVTSFGRTCAGVNSPGVYTKVSSFIDWIESIVWN